MATLTVPSVSYPTIQAALNACNVDGGDIVEIAGGTYTEALDLRNPSGGWLTPVTIRAADASNKPIIASTGAAQAVRGDAPRKGTATGIPVFENLVFSGWTSATNGVIYFNTQPMRVSYCTFQGNTGRRCVRSLFGTSIDQGIVEGCIFKTSGESVVKASNYVTIRNCVSFPETNTAFESGTGFLTNTYVVNNSVYGTWNTGGSTRVMQGASLYYANVIQNVGTGGSHAIDATGGTYTENLAYGTFTTNFAGTNGGGNDTGSNPGFVNPGAFDLTTDDTSPCYRTAAVSALALLTIEGIARSDPTDKGAYEYTIPTTEVVDADGQTDGANASRVVLTLGEEVDNDSTWEDPSNYTVAPTGAGADVTVVQGVIEDATTIRLDTTEQTDGATYEVTWFGLTHIADGSMTFTGAGTAPTVVSAELTGALTLRVVFSEAMTDDAELVDAANYTVADGEVASVVRVDSVTVDLTLAARITAAESTVAAAGMTDLGGNPCDSSVDFSVPYLTLIPPGVPNAERTSLTVQFNVPPTVGTISSPGDWTVEALSLGVSVGVVAVDTGDGTTVTVEVYPPMTAGVTYRITPVNAENGLGPIG